MEKHKCKLCFKTFMNGKALGGHMSRSHFTNLPLPAKTPQNQEEEEDDDDITESTSTEFSSEGHESEGKTFSYGLRENPKKSFKLTDAELLDAGSVVQDKESETESTRKPTRRRSKRAKRTVVDNVVSKPDQELLKKCSTESLTELEMASSVSDAAVATSNEDVALCLLMLSRDVWSSNDSVELKLSQTRCKHRCDMCNKVFKSSQALGGHRIIHRNIDKKRPREANSRHRGATPSRQCEISKKITLKSRNVDGGVGNVDQKVHMCPFCGKVFGSGQALGGHKRSHLLGTPTTAVASCSSSKDGDTLADSNSPKFLQDGLIDLNLPAPMEDEVVSDTDFVIKRTDLELFVKREQTSFSN